MTEDKVIEWMSARGHTGYANEIEALTAIKWEIIGEAGRYWQHCEFTQQSLKQLDAEIAEVKQAALDRYNDWASD